MKKLIKTIGRKFGLEISRYNPRTSDEAKLRLLLSSYKIDLVLDVGANIGQFVKYIRSCGYKKKMISFEPLSSAYNKLNIVSNKDHLWHIAPRAAIGNEEGKIEINLSKN